MTSPKKNGKLTEKRSIKILVGIFGVFLIFATGIICQSYVAQHPQDPHATDRYAVTPATNSDSQNPSSVSGNTNDETKYRQWVKEDYKRWENAMSSSSELYKLYQAAQSVTPPEKYKEFHQHYIKSYYYYYMAHKAAENNNDNDVGYYTDLALAEDDQLGEYMPDYAQLTAS